MPSASTTRPFAASAAIESSLWERTMPGSVQVAISRIWLRSMSELDVDAARGRRGARRCDGERGAQRAAEFFAGLEALLGFLRQDAAEEGHQAGRQAGVVGADIDRPVVGDA